VTRLKAYITGRPITARLPNPSSFEESLTNPPTNKIPPIPATDDTSRDKRANSQNTTLLPNELELVGKSFQIGRKWFFVIAVEYDRGFQAKIARYKPCKYNPTTGTYTLVAKRKPPFIRSLDQVEDLVKESET
jgi:hypothetical protein